MIRVIIRLDRKVIRGEQFKERFSNIELYYLFIIDIFLPEGIIKLILAIFLNINKILVLLEFKIFEEVFPNILRISIIIKIIFNHLD